MMMMLLVSILALLVLPAWAEQPALILNAANTPGELPRHFRSCAAAKGSDEGLRTLRLSGSAQFSDEGLKALLKQLGTPDKVVVVDLRQESHGFLNGTAVSWFTLRNWANQGKTSAQIRQEELQLLADQLKAKTAVVQQIVEKTPEGDIEVATRETFDVQSALSEEQVTKNQKVGYYRLYVTDHKRPTDADVQQFMAFVKGQPSDAWLHIHCAAGDGRTTTFMAMIDMMNNAKKVSFETILQRQAAIGGIDLLQKHHEGSWKRPLAIERIQFLQKFYDFCKHNVDDFKTPWK